MYLSHCFLENSACSGIHVDPLWQNDEWQNNSNNLNSVTGWMSAWSTKVICTSIVTSISVCSVLRWIYTCIMSDDCLNHMCCMMIVFLCAVLYADWWLSLCSVVWELSVCSVVWELLSVCCVACQMKIVFIILLLYDVLYDGCLYVVFNDNCLYVVKWLSVSCVVL